MACYYLYSPRLPFDFCFTVAKDGRKGGNSKRGKYRLSFLNGPDSWPIQPWSSPYTSAQRLVTSVPVLAFVFLSRVNKMDILRSEVVYAAVHSFSRYLCLPDFHSRKQRMRMEFGVCGSCEVICDTNSGGLNLQSSVQYCIETAKWPGLFPCDWFVSCLLYPCCLGFSKRCTLTHARTQAHTHTHTHCTEIIIQYECIN